MEIKQIKFVDEAIDDLYIDRIDVLVENINGYTYTVSVTTPDYLSKQMREEKSDFISPCSPMIIVKKLSKEIVKQAIEFYAENDGYWLKLCQFGNAIDISILNKLETEHRQEWEEN